jgi:sugar phosphate isomerase/epimerase
MGMRLGLAIQTSEVEPVLPVALLSGTFEEKLEKAARFGADGVELITVDPRSLDVERIRLSLARCGLEAAAVASGGLAFALGLTLLNANPQKAAQANARLFDLIDFASTLGAGVVTIGSFRGRAAWAGANAREELVAILKDAAAYADERGVRLALEPLNRFESDIIANVGQGLEFLLDVSHPALGLLLDTFHVNIEESSWIEPFRRAMAVGKLFHVHLGDNHRRYPGQGLIDFPAIVSTLSQGGYSGYLSAELLAIPDPDTAAQGTLAYMRPLLEA